MTDTATQPDSDAIRPWNMVVTLRPGDQGEVRQALNDIGQVGTTAFADVLLLRAERPLQALQMLQVWGRINPTLCGRIERIVPVSQSFDFDDCAEFERRATATLRGWLPSLAGQCLGIHGHRRDAEAGEAQSDASSRLKECLRRTLRALGLADPAERGEPDIYLDVECIGNWAGFSLWTRGQLERYPELGLGAGEAG